MVAEVEWDEVKIQGLVIYQPLNGGEGGIRTHEGCYPLTLFESAAFNRSATSP